jgi:hypothetical protein
MRRLVLVTGCLALAACPKTHAWRTPAAAGILAATVASNAIAAILGKQPGRPDRTARCPPTKAPDVKGCLASPREHDGAEPCTYFCFTHCRYHVGDLPESASASDPPPKGAPYEMAEGCLPPPLERVDGCVEREMKLHDDAAPCVYFCMQHCTYHDGTRGKVRR